MHTGGGEIPVSPLPVSSPLYCMHTPTPLSQELAVAATKQALLYNILLFFEIFRLRNIHQIVGAGVRNRWFVLSCLMSEGSEKEREKLRELEKEGEKLRELPRVRGE